MPGYSVKFTKQATNSLQSLHPDIQSNILKAIEKKLCIDPFAWKTEELAGYDKYRRLRAGAYRIIYTVETDITTIFILRVGHRRDIYKKLEEEPRPFKEYKSMKS